MPNYRGLVFWMTVYRFFWHIIPKRYAVPGKTRVRVDSYTYKYGKKTSMHSSEMMGTVLMPEYWYAGPFEQKSGFEIEGVYFSSHPNWPHHWAVKLDDADGTVEQHDLPQSEYLSGYRWGLPLLDRIRSWDGSMRMWSAPTRRLGDLPHPIEYYSGDYVVYSDDPTQTPRMVTAYWFGMDGRLTYSLGETLAERNAKHEAARLEAEKTGRSYGMSGGVNLKYHQVPGSSLRLVRRGNGYHIAHGKPEDLSFPHVTLEVDFWKGIGVWLSDNHEFRDDPKYKRAVSSDEAEQMLVSGDIDTVHTGREVVYHQIRLPERFAAFRQRSRAASLEYLTHYAGKYSFDVVPEEVRAEYAQTDF